MKKHFGWYLSVAVMAVSCGFLVGAMFGMVNYIIVGTMGVML